jgi:hypothetical protein
VRALAAALLLAACSYERPARYDPPMDALLGACAVNNGGCSVNATCTPNGSMAVCQCKADYAGDGRTCTQVWELAYSYPNLQLQYGWGYVVTAIGNKIYFAPEFDQAGKYFKAIDVTDGTVQDRAMPPLYNGVQNEFCACGGPESLIAAGTLIYALGNAGSHFDTTTGDWLQLNAASYPSSRWDAAGAEAQGRAYVMGGTPDGTLVQFYANGTLSNAPPLPFSADAPGAFAIQNTIYVFGGGTGRNEVASLDTSSPNNTWVNLGTAPVDLFVNITIVQVGTKLVLTSGVANRLYVYDPVSNTWPGTYFDLPPGEAWKLVMANGSAYALGQRTEAGVPTVVLYKLRAIP